MTCNVHTSGLFPDQVDEQCAQVDQGNVHQIVEHRYAPEDDKRLCGPSPDLFCGGDQGYQWTEGHQQELLKFIRIGGNDSQNRHYFLYLKCLPKMG